MTNNLPISNTGNNDTKIDVEDNDELFQMKLNQFFPQEEIDKVTNEIPRKSLRYYGQIKTLPSLPDSSEKIPVWEKKVLEILEQKKHPVYTALSELAFENVKKLEGRFITTIEEIEYKKYQNVFRNYLKKLFQDKLKDISKIKSILSDSAHEQNQLKEKYGDMVSAFSKYIPTIYFMDVYRELTFAEHYGIPKNEQNLKRWLEQLSTSPGRLNQVADEIAIALRQDSILYCDDQDSMRKGISIVLKGLTEHIAAGIAATRSLDLYEELYNQVNEMGEQKNDINTFLLNELSGQNKDILRFFYNKFYEQWIETRDAEKQIMGLIISKIPVLQEMWKDAEKRIRAIMLIRYSLKTVTPRARQTFDVRDLKDHLGDLVQYQNEIHEILKVLKIKGPKNVQDYLKMELYLQETESFENERQEVDTTLVALRNSDIQNIMGSKQLLITKLSFFSIFKYDDMRQLYNAFNSETNMDFSKLKEFTTKNFNPNEDISTWIKIVFKLMPDKIKVTYSIENIIPEIVEVAFKIIQIFYEKLTPVIKSLLSKDSFKKIAVENPDKAAAFISNLFLQGKLAPPFKEYWSGNQIQINMLMDIFKTVI